MRHPGSRATVERHLNGKIQRLLRNLQASLSEALAGSSDVNRVLQEIREEGWSLYLVIDRDEDDASEPDDGEQEAALEISPRPALAAGEPIFKIDGRDLSFLRSVGIDPTRKLRRRRSG